MLEREGRETERERQRGRYINRCVAREREWEERGTGAERDRERCIAREGEERQTIICKHNITETERDT